MALRANLVCRPALGPRACVRRSPPPAALSVARLPRRARPARLLTAPRAASSTTTTTVPERPTASAVAPGSCAVSLMFPDSAGAAQPQPQDLCQLLQVDRALLWHASPVLRGLIESGGAVPTTQPAPQPQAGGAGAAGTNSPSIPTAAAAAAAASKPGATTPSTTTASSASNSGSLSLLLTLTGDNRRDWEAVVQILQHKALPVTWDNVTPLLRLADKYDMAAVRTACAGFLAVSASQVSLSEPLDSPKNLLHAASLAEKYLLPGAGGGGSSSGGSSGSSSGSGASQQPNLQPYVAVINSALEAALKPLHTIVRGGGNTDITAWQPPARNVVGLLTKLIHNSTFKAVVAPGVQGSVMLAMLSGLDALTAINVK
ncbi:hypothetical protein HXX76_008059 [Chlamydomonas incerta]|uniref:Uncharacterized protein n=1 Tax=Chlamydomonas incerta TaxID=51695 RepID=A0A835SUZ5_CHLIN|nr:hypothetical protein HXX76_008059 [Chlamydomonas incerta]|eukprot:KAG2433689.1 hypothetical protein HXX76_008059 [Chlamydomonas incerta]